MSNPEDNADDDEDPAALAAERRSAAPALLAREAPSARRTWSRSRSSCGSTRVELVTIDPIAKHIRLERPEHGARAAGRDGRADGCAIVGVHHLNKRLPEGRAPAGRLRRGERRLARDGARSRTCSARRAVARRTRGSSARRRRTTAGTTARPSSSTSTRSRSTCPNGDVDETGRIVFVNDTARSSRPSAIVHFKGARLQGRRSPREEAGRDGVPDPAADERARPPATDDLRQGGRGRAVSRTTVRRAAEASSGS